MRIKPGIASAIDQAWLSMLNLAISFAFIRFATKDDYGTYLLLLTPLYLMMGIQNALILSPIATVLPSSPSEDKDVVYTTAIAAQVAFVGLSGVIGSAGLAAYWYVEHGTIYQSLVVGFGLAIAGVCAREGARTLFYTRNNAIGALTSDLVYGGGLMLAIGLLSYCAALTPVYALLAMGLAALWPYLFRWTRVAGLHLDRRVIHQFWACGRWALVGVVVTWINLSAYPLIVGLTLNSAAVADINVARLFLMPVGLCITAWSNLYRPKISAWAAADNVKAIKRLSVKSIGMGLGLLATFSGTVAALYPVVETLLGATYFGLLPVVMLWSLFFALNLARSILMATLMTKAEGYKQLKNISWLALAVSLSGLWFFSAKGAVWVVGVLVAVELVQCILIGLKAISWWHPKKTSYE